MNKPSKCSLCGQPGHNRRTCGHNTPKGTPPLPALPKPTQTPRTLARSASPTLSGVIGKVPQPEPTVDETSLQELQTLWALSNGRTGKQEAPPAGWVRSGTVVQWDNTDTDQLVTTTSLATSVTPTRTLTRFLRTFGTEARIRLAEHPDTSDLTLATLATDASPAVKTALLRRRTLPPAALEGLSEDKNLDIRKSVAKRHDTPAPIITRMYEKEKAEMLARATRTRSDSTTYTTALERNLATNPNLPARYMHDCAQSQLVSLADATLTNPNVTPEDIGHIWDNHKKTNGVQQNILEHKRTPESIFDEYVTTVTSPHPGALAWNDKSIDAGLALVANNPSAPTRALDRIFAHYCTKNVRPLDITVLEGLARNPHTTTTALTFLTRTMKSSVIADEAEKNLTARKPQK